MRRHGVATDDFKLPGNQAVEGQGRILVAAQHQSDLNMTSPPSQTEDGVSAGFGAAECIHGEVRATVR